MDATAGNPLPSPEPAVDEVMIATSDGHHLAGDVATPAGARAVAVLCHPHPDYGGDRFNTMVDELFRALPAVAVAALRFDFRRPVGGDGLGAAPLDVSAALEDAVRRFAGLPLLLVGYSFGAAAALTAASRRSDVARLVLIAPPLSMLPVVEAPAVPTLVLVPAHDQFSPPDAVEPAVRAWREARLETIEMADHFLAGRTSWIASRVCDWLTA